MSRMWRLDAFRFDEEIAAGDVYVLDEEKGELVQLSRDEAIATAHERGLHLIASWPAGSEDDTPSCFIGKVAEPIRWETVVAGSDEEADPRLWFDASCGGRDFLFDGQGHTFRGRMSAWCPEKQVSYNVSLAEMGPMSEEAEYFVRGFLSGSEPSPPEDDEGNIAPEDLQAWRAATARYRRTGSWYGRWGTCRACGCVLLPDSAADTCEEHAPSP